MENPKVLKQKANKNIYQPGVCNIGKAEIEKRRRAGLAGLFLALLYTAVAKIFLFPWWMQSLVFFPAVLAAIGFFQVYFHFCAYYGLMSAFNFGDDTAKTSSVLEQKARELDQSRARQIISYSIISACIYALLMLLLTH